MRMRMVAQVPKYIRQVGSVSGTWLNERSRYVQIAHIKIIHDAMCNQILWCQALTVAANRLLVFESTA